MAVESAVEVWAGRIRAHMASAADSIIAAGRELIEAKAALPHGSWGKLCDRLGIHPRTAHRFMAIASNPALANRTHGSDLLPHSWTTLYELSKVEPDRLDAAIDAGQVTPELGRSQAQRLQRWTPPAPAPDPEPDPERHRTQLSATCRGCALCAGHTAHYLTASPPPQRSMVRIVYVDADLVVYDRYTTVDDVAADNEICSPDLRWCLEVLPWGEDAYVMRQPVWSEAS